MSFKSAGKFFLISSLIFFSRAISFGQNPIPAENLLPGNPASEWDVSGAGDLSIQGFATDISVNKGSTVHFKIDLENPATNYSIKIYRLGYYQGNGARLVADLGNFSGTSQHFVNPDPVTGLTDCSSWNESASWNVPVNAVSGLYIVKLTRADNNGSSHMVFIVRDDAGNSPILFKTSDATWQAYNHYRYHSLYIGPIGAFSHAVKVSYNRPFYTRDGLGGGNGTKDWLFNAEYPMIRWMERNGYNVSYTTDLDMDRDPTPITPSVHKILLSVGHDEYWSAGERTKFENARDAGVHLAFFSGNEAYWKTRWENNHRTLVCYKEGTLGEYNCGGKCDPLSDTWTGLWRDGCNPPYAPNDGCSPENSLSGQISWSNSRGAIEVPAIYKDFGFWRNTSIAGSSTGQTVSLPYGTLGDEWDAYQDLYASTYPAHRILFSSTLLHGQIHNLSLYRHSSGALVFGAGTIQWAWGLDENHDNDSGPNSLPSADMQQATVNLFADMGVMPETLQSGLVASATGDNQPPGTIITYPSNGVNLPSTVVTITGTAMDAGGGIVAGVEVSLDGGTTWHPAVGTGSWTYSWQPEALGLVNIKARAWDDLGNLGVPGIAGSPDNITVTVTGEIYYTLFQSITPSSSAINYIGDGTSPLEMGMKFRSSIDGYIDGFRYFKGVGAQGVHIGNLWSIAGTNLASATFTGETASGWQTVTLTTPVAITANTIYVVSYFSPHGDFMKTSPYFTADIVNGPLTGLGWTEAQPNGVYRYNATSAFPNNNAFIGSTNYWADVLFTPTQPPDITSPTIVSVLPVNNTTSVPITNHPSAIFSESLDPLTVNTNTFTLTGPGSTPVAGSVVTSNGTATFTPDSPLAVYTTFIATLIGGATDPRIKDLAGNALAAEYSWQFTTENLSIPSITIQPGSQNACNGSSVSFISAATGSPLPTLQWQVSSDNGNHWHNITGAVTSPYTFTVAVLDNGKQFRAVWTNSTGSTNSSAATLTVIPSITATISSVSASACLGSPFQLQLSEAIGQPPFSLVVNGKTYDGVIVGQAFTTISTTEESLWADTTLPAVPAQNDGAAQELGVKFRTAVDGYIKGIRFYKGYGNSGTHTGSLWTTSGIQIAHATFINESFSGWQEVRFETPVAISSNTTYIASYHAPMGNYAKDYNYFINSHYNGSMLEAPRALGSDGNGVSKYTSNPAGEFPEANSADSSNYWVDVVFSYSNSDTTFINNLTSITENGGCTRTGNPLSSTIAHLSSPPAPNVAGVIIYCKEAIAIPLAATGTDLLWYTTITGGTGTGTAPTPSTASSGITSYYVSQTVEGCESPRAQIDVVVNPVVDASVSIEVSQNNVCARTSVTFTATPTNGEITPAYQWKVNGTNAGTDTLTYSYVPENNDTITCVLTSNETCATGSPATSNAVVMAINPLPAGAGTINGQSLICERSAGIVYTIPLIANATSYEWTVPQGATIVSGSGTNTITVDFASSAVSGDISVYCSNDCGNGTASPAFAVTVKAVPSAPVITLDGFTLTSDAQSGSQWYIEGVLIPGETNAIYNVTQTATYWSVEMLDGCASDTSNNIYVLWTGINTIAAGQFELYPVPSNGLFTATMIWPKTELITIRVFNSFGSLMFEKKDILVKGSSKHLIDLSTAPAGMYTVTFTSGTNQVNRKMIINRKQDGNN